MTALDPEHPNPIESKSDRELVRDGSPFATLEITRRLRNTIIEQQRATNDLTERIRKLNVWLLIVTVAIGMTTLVQAAAAWRSLMP
jgi:hypothetical protein